jgi:ferredoxin-NADP reductase
MPNEENSPRFYGLSVAGIRDESLACRSLILAAPETAISAFRASPGQFLTIRVTIAGRLYERCYSISSLASLDEPLRVTVKRVPNGTVSHWLNNNLKEGDTLAVAPPAGRFALRGGARRALFFAAGSGITPILPMIRQAIEVEKREAALLLCNRDLEDAIFLEELRSLASRHADRFELVEHYGRRDDPQRKQFIRAFASKLGVGDVYSCGPSGFMAHVREALQESGVREEDIYEERFTPEPDISGDRQLATEPSTDAPPSTVTIVYGGATHTIRADPRDALLDAILGAGLTVPHSCKEGHCGACMVRLLGGEIQAQPGSALSRRDRQKGYILACRSRPTSPDIFLSYDP